jgi:hypothetical protein
LTIAFFERDFVVADQDGIHALQITKTPCFCMPLGL